MDDLSKSTFKQQSFLSGESLLSCHGNWSVVIKLSLCSILKSRESNWAVSVTTEKTLSAEDDPNTNPEMWLKAAEKASKRTLRQDYFFKLLFPVFKSLWYKWKCEIHLILIGFQLHPVKTTFHIISLRFGSGFWVNYRWNYCIFGDYWKWTSVP